MSSPMDTLASVIQKTTGIGETEVSRKPHFAEKVMIVDGQDGCGKTLIATVLAAFDRVELLTYAYELEYICSFWYLKKIELDAAVTAARMLTDLRLYNTLMCRETNFRWSDLSSVFRDHKPLRYFHRLFQKGDEYTPDRIKKENPILMLTVHDILDNSEPVFKGLNERLVFVESVRHPLYMIKQQFLDIDGLYENPRDFRIYIKWKDREVPYWAKGWEELYVKSNSIERVIYNMRHFFTVTEKAKKEFSAKYKASITTIPFEPFVLDPWPYLEEVKKALGVEITPLVRRILKKNKVPRKMYADGVGLRIYKRCGWQPPQKGSTESDEFALRWRFAVEKGAGPQALKVLEEISTIYEERYLGGRQEYPRPFKI